MQEDLAQKKFSQCHTILNFWRHVPESKYPEFEIPVYNSFLRRAQRIAMNFFLCNEVHKIKPLKKALLEIAVSSESKVAFSPIVRPLITLQQRITTSSAIFSCRDRSCL